MKDIIDMCPAWYKIVLIFNATLIAVSFILPPRGIIDPSVLAGVGEIFGGAFLGLLPGVVKNAKNVKVSKGDTSIEVSSEDND